MCHPPVVMIKILSCMVIFFALLQTVCHRPVVINILGCVIISFQLHQTVSRVLPTSYGELNIKLHGNFFSPNIKLFEVCHPPVVMIKILSCVIISFRLHQTVSRVLPTSYGELNIKLYGNFFLLTSNCLRWETRRL